MLFSSSGNFARQADIYIHQLRFLSHCDNNHPYPHPQHLKHQGLCAMCPLLSYHILSLERAGGWLTFLCYIFCPYNSICGGYVCVCEWEYSIWMHILVVVRGGRVELTGCGAMIMMVILFRTLIHKSSGMQRISINSHNFPPQVSPSMERWRRGTHITNQGYALQMRVCISI